MNNNNTTAVTNASTSSLPLTREEMATYMSYLTETTEAQNNAFVEALSNLKDTYNKKIDTLCDTIKDSITLLVKAQTDNSAGIESLRKSLFVIGKSFSSINNTATDVKSVRQVNPKLVNTASVTDVKEWIGKAWDSCEIIGNKCGKTKLRVLRDVYAHLREIDGEFDEVYNEYKNGNVFNKPSIINMIGYSDHYRPLVEEYIKQLYYQCCPVKTAVNITLQADNVKTKKKSKSLALRCIPGDVEDIISDYAKKRGISNRGASNILVSKLSKSCGLNFYKAKEDFLKNIGYKNCGSTYFISQVPALLAMFKSIAEE